MTATTTQPPARPSGLRWPVEPLRLAAFGGLLLLVGLAGTHLVEDTTVVFGAVLLVVVLPLVNSRPSTWIALAIAVVWTSRLFTVVGSAPRFLDFLDFPLVLIAFLLSGVRFLGTTRVLDPAQRRIGRRLLLVTSVIAASWAFTNLGEPQRLIAGWVLAVEPFLLLMAVVLAPMTGRERTMLLRLITTLLASQLVFSLAEIAAGGVADEVKGTLLAAGAGHHVSAGGLVLAYFLLARTVRSRLLALGFGALALLVVIIADAKQVLFVLPLALLVFAVTGRRRRSATSLAVSVGAGVVMAFASVAALLSYQASSTAFTFLDRASTNKTGKFAVVDALWHDICGSPISFALGFGPGETVSRFAFLTTPALFKEGSPVALLGLHASTGADHYNAIAFSGPFTGASSFTSAQSSALGVLGDYGVLGLASFLALAVAVVAALNRTPERRLRSAALGSWTLLVPLAVVFDWLEQPPFTLAVMLVTGLALRGPDTLDRAQRGDAERDSEQTTELPTVPQAAARP